MKGVAAVHDNFTQVYDKQPREVPVARKSILPVTAKPLPPASAAAGPPWIRTWGVGDRLNGRLPLILPERIGKPALIWKKPLAPHLSPNAIYTAKDRAIVVGAGEWDLFDSTGVLLTSHPLGSTILEFDSASQRVMAADMNGWIQFWRVSDGAPTISLEPMFTRLQTRSRLVIRGNILVLGSQAMDGDVHAPPVRKSMIETFDLAVNAEEAALKNKIRDSDVLLTVVTEDTIVAATEGRIYFLDFDLNFKDAWSAADFLPLGISLDEQNNVYMQARVGTPVRLWKIDKNAGLLWDIPLPNESAVIFQPPVVAYDHTVYLLSAQQILAIGEDGKILWKKAGAGPIRGGLVTADNRLLITEGSLVTAFDRAGNREVIHDFGDTLTTPPALAPNGVIYAASRAYLYALQLSR